jgi:putative transport protein
VRHADASTSTATLPAVLDVMKNSDPSIGYSTAYPFGVIVPILCIYLMTRQVQSKFPPKRQGFRMAEATLGRTSPGAKSASSAVIHRAAPRLRITC